jgi:hypothetical protein
MHYGMASSLRDDDFVGLRAALLPPPPTSHRELAGAPARQPGSLPPSSWLGGASLPATASPSAAPNAVTYFGPMGRRRSSPLLVAFSVLSLGFYGLVWHNRINREMVHCDPRMRARPGRSVAALAIPFVAAWGVALAAGAILLLDRFGVAWNDPVGTSRARLLLGAPLVLSYLLILFPLSFGAILGTLERVRTLEDRVDIVGDGQIRPTRTVCWLLLPLIGGLAFLTAVQRRLNTVWTRVATG